MTIDKKVKLFRVILADDNKDMLDTIAAVLEPAAEFDIVTTVADGKALVDAALQLKPDIGIIDISMPIMTGIEAVGEIRKVDPHMKIVFLTVNEDRDFVDAAFEAGARHMTHFFNAMTGVHHRDIGVAGWGLSTEGVTFDMIADGIHVDKRMVAMACRSKGIYGVTLISDSVAPTGLGDGEFDLWGEKISVTNGRTRNERGSIAGSVITMLDAVRNMLALGFSEAEVATMASTNPARLLGVDSIVGSIEPGKRADLVALDKQGNIRWTMIEGRIVES